MFLKYSKTQSVNHRTTRASSRDIFEWASTTNKIITRESVGQIQAVTDLINLNEFSSFPIIPQAHERNNRVVGTAQHEHSN